MAVRASSRKGVTLSGVLIATLLISLAVTPLMSLLITEQRATRWSKNRAFAVHLATNVVERFRMEKAEDLRYALDSLQAGKAFIATCPLLSPANFPPKYEKLLSSFERFALFVPGPRADERHGTLFVIVKWIEDGHSREVRQAIIITDPRFPGGKP